jgi:hypothetical protein
MPTVPVYDLQVHPRDRELIAGTHGRAIMVLDVAPLQQFTGTALSAPATLFAPAVALQYGERPVGSEPRAQRMWRGERTNAGATIRYRLAQPVQGGVRLSIVNAMGDTIARITGTNTVGMNTVVWNFLPTGSAPMPAIVAGGFGFGGGAAPANPNLQVPGFPRGFDPRPAERGVADSTGSPTYQARQLAQPAAAGRGQGGGGGGFGGGFGGGRALTPVETGDYRVVLHSGTTAMAQPLRVVRVAPEERAVLIPAKR